MLQVTGGSSVLHSRLRPNSVPLVTETGNYIFMAKVRPSQRTNEEPFGYGDRQLRLHGQSSPIPTKQ